MKQRFRVAFSRRLLVILPRLGVISFHTQTVMIEITQPIQRGRIAFYRPLFVIVPYLGVILFYAVYSIITSFQVFERT